MTSPPKGTRYTHHLYKHLRDVPVGISLLVLFVDPPEGPRVAKGVVVDVWNDGLEVDWIHWERGERPTRQIFTEADLRALAFYNPECS